MKKLFLIIGIAFSLSLTSCVYRVDTVKKADLPIEVANLKEAEKFDTLLVIQTETKTYQFTKDKEYVGAYNNKTDEASENNGFILLIILTLVFICFMPIFF